MIVVRLYLQPSGFWRRLWYGLRQLRGCTMTTNREQTFYARACEESLQLYEPGLSTSLVHIPRGYQLVVSVSDR